MVRGYRTFGEFLASGEGIATNVLAGRLRKLEAGGILTVERAEADGRRRRYRLTDKGIALAPVVLELLIWAARYEETSAPCELIEQMARNREGVLAEVKRRWAEDDPAPFLPKFRTKEQTEDL